MRSLLRPSSALPALLTLLVLSAAHRADAATCLESRDFYQSLPAVIGREDQMGKLPFVLNCDTVFVRKGVTTTVYPGTMLYFARPSLNCVIKVEGTLILKGTKSSYVTLSGSLDSAKGGMEPGKRTWGGIEVAEGGRLEADFAGFMAAPTPITAFSTQVKLVNCWFKGSSGLIRPDGTLYQMETEWHAINEMDLSKGGTDKKVASDRPDEALSEEERDKLLAKKDKGFWTWKKVAGGAAAVAVVGVGLAYMASGDEAGSPPVIKPSGNKTNPVDKIPDLPASE